MADSLEKKYASADGKEIFITQETEKHLLAHPDTLPFLEEAISKIQITDGTINFQEAINLGRTIGISLLVGTELIALDEQTDFSVRVGREWPVRIVTDSKGEPCDSVTLGIRFDEKSQEYVLTTAYIGYPCPHSPYYIEDKTGDEYKESLNFWCSHALAYDPKIMGKPFKTSWNSVLNKQN